MSGQTERITLKSLEHSGCIEWAEILKNEDLRGLEECELPSGTKFVHVGLGGEGLLIIACCDEPPGNRFRHVIKTLIARRIGGRWQV